MQRLSLGVQALDNDALAFLGRNHDAAAAMRALRLAAKTFPRLSLDLIYALPGQTPAAWAETLRRAAGFGAEHLSPYQLTIEAGTAFDRAVRRSRFTPVDEERGAALYDTTQATLEALGFHAYEVSNHAKGDAARSRHNLIYWRGEDYVGVGPRRPWAVDAGGRPHRHDRPPECDRLHRRRPRHRPRLGRTGDPGRPPPPPRSACSWACA